jgi:hypothetical protein
MRMLRVTTTIAEVSENKTLAPLPPYQNELKFDKGILRETLNIDNAQLDTQSTPIEIPVINQTTGVFIRATYAADYLEDNISKGDPALIQVEFNNSGSFIEASAYNLENFNPSSIKIKALGTKVIRVERTISAE